MIVYSTSQSLHLHLALNLGRWNDRKDDELLEKGDEEGGIKLGDHFRLSFFDNYVNELKEQRKSEWRSV